MKKFFVFFVLICVTCALFAGAGVNPSDSFYNDAMRWEALNIIPELPALRPYPISLIKSIIETVSACEIESEAALAKEYYEKEFNYYFHVNFEAVEDIKFSKDSKTDKNVTDKKTTVLGNIDGNAELTGKINLAFDIGVVAEPKNAKNVLPMFARKTFDTARDPTTIKNIIINIDCNSVISFGDPSMYFTAGIGRSSFGPLQHTSLVYDKDTFHAPFLSFVINKDFLTYTQSLFSLSATNNIGTGSEFPEKYLGLHSFDLHLSDKFTFSYYENIIFGNRFDFTYLFPVPYMVAQSFAGFRDNLQMGIGARYNPSAGAKFTADFFVDDISANDLAKLNFDTKIQAAAQVGAFFAFANSKAKSLKADLTLIMPWMYTHHETTTNRDLGYVNQFVETNKDGTKKTITEPIVLGKQPNYQNYTHFGQNIGNAMPQNSARLYYEINFKPAKGLDIDFYSCVMRHANINETLSRDAKLGYLNAVKGQFLTDGSNLNYPNYGAGHLSEINEFQFLAQATPMTISQTGLNAKYTLDTKFGNFSLNVKYMFEYINNYGVQNNIWIGRGVYDTDGKLTNPATDDDIKDAYNKWKDNIITHTFNNYLTISVKYSY